MTVAGEQGWLMDDDPVVHLRRRGARGEEHEFKLPAKPINAWTIGAASDCALQLEDRSGMLSRHHAVLVRDLRGWVVEDTQSTNGTRLDGERRSRFELLSGVELGVGSIELVAESARLIALRNVLDRWIGWSPAKHADADAALRAIRYMATLRGSLVLRGDGDLAPLAARLHREALGDRRPFILAGADADGVAKLYAAANGTLCIQAGRLPLDWPDVVLAVRSQRLEVRTILLATSGSDRAADDILQLPTTYNVELPSLAQRRDEAERVIHEYATEAAEELRAPSINFRNADWERLRSRRWSGIATLEHDVRRLVALRAWHLVEAARRLGITHSALSKWATRRGFATF